MLEHKKLEDLLVQGKINRREFLTRISALGLAAAVSPAFLAATTHASTPKKGGLLRIGLSGASVTDDLDPGTIADVALRNINWQIRNNLVEIDNAGKAIPELAESWEPTPDAARWVFKIRKGVEFHNGKSLDAEDVVWSINHHRNETSKSAAKSLLKSVEDIKTDGKYIVIFTLKSKNADFPYILSDVHLSIALAGTTGADWNKGIGTGGYRLVEFEPGVRIFTKKNPNYWKEGRAHFDEIENLCIIDVVARTNALKTDRIDAMSSCDLKTAQFLEKAPNIQLARVTGRKHFSFPMLMDVSPYNNSDVRMALKYGIDRVHLVKTVLHGYGSPGNDHPIAPVMRYYASELPQREYDPDKAKFHVNKAGMGGHTFKLHTCRELYSGSLDAAVLYKEHAAKAGIKIDVALEPKDGYWKKIWIQRNWCASYWSGRPTEDMMFTNAYAEESNWNESHFKHDRFNHLLKEARAELDDTKRREMYVEMQKIVRDEGGSVIPMFTDFVDAASTKVGFVKLSGHYELDGSRCAERWWFKS